MRGRIESAAMSETNGTNRLDRIERALELLIDDHVQFREEHKQLLTAQVVLTDRLDRFIKVTTEAQLRTDEALRRTDEALRRTDVKLGELADKLNGLIGYVAGQSAPKPE
jgi:hypothetical protein